MGKQALNSSKLCGTSKNLGFRTCTFVLNTNNASKHNVKQYRCELVFPFGFLFLLSLLVFLLIPSLSDFFILFPDSLQGFQSDCDFCLNLNKTNEKSGWVDWLFANV